MYTHRGTLAFFKSRYCRHLWIRTNLTTPLRIVTVYNTALSSSWRFKWNIYHQMCHSSDEPQREAKPELPIHNLFIIKFSLLLCQAMPRQRTALWWPLQKEPLRKYQGCLQTTFVIHALKGIDQHMPKANLLQRSKKNSSPWNTVLKWWLKGFKMKYGVASTPTLSAHKSLRVPN